jgi:hypothetical protein
MRTLFAKVDRLLRSSWGDLKSADARSSAGARCAIQENTRQVTMELISVHIPKTAGTAFRRVLEKAFAPDALLLDYVGRSRESISLFETDVTARRNQNLRKMAEIPPQARCVHGHFWLRKYAEQFPSARKIVWLRHPVHRLISHYFFWKNRPSDNRPQKRMLDERMTLLEFAALKDMQNVVTKTFLNDFIGVQEFFAQDLERLQKMMGWQIQSVPVENRTADRKYATFQPDADIIRKISALNEADMDLYRTTLSRREQCLVS